MKATWITVASLVLGFFSGSHYGSAKASGVAAVRPAVFQMRMRCMEWFKERDTDAFEVVDYSPQLNTCLDAKEVVTPNGNLSFIRDVSGRMIYTHHYSNANRFDVDMERLFAELTGTTGTQEERFHSARGE